MLGERNWAAALVLGWVKKVLGGAVLTGALLTSAPRGLGHLAGAKPISW